MLSVLDVWRRGFPDAASEKQGQAVLQRQLQQQIRLVNDLLDVSRITSGRIELQRAFVDVSRIVSQSVEDLRGVFDAGQRHVSLTLPAEALWVHGDATRLAQVVSNLLGNAVKYSNSGGQIRVTVAREGSTALLKVADNGMGIAPGLMPTIFDLFVQEKRSLDRSQGGLGLGLTLVRRIVELHGGTVEAHSAGVNQGSEFIVRLPASPAPDVHLSVAQAETSRPASIAPLRVLVVDDNPDSAESIAMLLSFDGHEVKTASDGPAGLKLAATFQPQVVLLDIGLPGMDGYEVARQMRELPQTTHALLIAVSGYGRAEDRERARQAGFDHHLVKPTSVDQLVNVIAAHEIRSQ
jgi:two-component system CheB/CheR fusion protein